MFGAHARVTFTQRYRNQESTPVEAVYVFPLDEGAAVCGFAAVVDGVRYEGVVKPREEAFAAYDDAMAAGHGAFLLDEERPDVFTASIGNLAPGAEAQIELTYVAELACEDDSIRFTLPTTVSPRYAPREDQGGVGRPPPRSSILLAVDEVPYGLSFTARWPCPGVSGASSRLLTRFRSISMVTARRSRSRRSTSRSTAICASSRRGDRRAAGRARTDEERPCRGGRDVPPPVCGRAVPAEIVFVVDRPGSMQGSSIEQVRTRFRFACDRLKPAAPSTSSDSARRSNRCSTRSGHTTSAR